MLFRRHLIVFALALSWFGLPGLTDAAPVDNPEVFTYDSNSGTPDPYGNPLGPFGSTPGSFQLPKFDDEVEIPHPDDPGFLTTRNLTLVVISVTASVYDGWFGVDNEGLNGANVLELTMEAQLTVASDTPDAPLVVVTFPRATASGTITGDTDGIYDYVGTDSMNIYANGESDSNSATLDFGGDDTLDPNDWSGVGEFITWEFDGDTFFKGVYEPSIDPASGHVPPNYQFEATVQYFWEVGSIPEPVTATLLGVGTAWLLVRKRRRRPSGCHR